MTFNVGDIIEIIDMGKAYSSYTDMAVHLKLKHYKPERSVMKNFKGEQGMVVAKGQHLREPSRIVYAVKIMDGKKPRDILFGETGIKLISARPVLDEDLFRI